MKEVVKILKEIEQINFPEDWVDPVQQILNQHNSELHNLDSKSKEFSVIEILLKETLTAGVVKKVEIVQNKHLWMAYQEKFQAIKNKLKKAPETKLLWHGTGATPPTYIYN